MDRRFLLPAVGLVLASVIALAHHSIPGAYLIEKEITVEGILREFHFVNPHPFLVVEVRGVNGIAKKWKFEMDNRSELSEAGMTKDTFKSGDRVIVKGNPAASVKESLYIRKLERPSDGFRYEQVGSSPRITSKSAN